MTIPLLNGSIIIMIKSIADLMEFQKGERVKIKDSCIFRLSKNFFPDKLGEIIKKGMIGDKMAYLVIPISQKLCQLVEGCYGDCPDQHECRFVGYREDLERA